MSCTETPPPEAHRFKVGVNRGRRRIWLDGKRLKDAGFIGGASYHCVVKSGSIVAILFSEDDYNERDTTVPTNAGTVIRRRKVTGRPDGKPIIDITGADVTMAVGQADAVQVRFTPGRITITPAT